MKRKSISGRMIVRVFLPLLFLLVMSFHYIPKLLHEVIGLLWLVAVMVHIWQNTRIPLLRSLIPLKVSGAERSF